jgi:predicted SnoaL-like aldol condensation-catalyzing enzyme
MDSIESVITAHLNAWNGPAGTGRDESIAAIYAPDVFVGEPAAAYRGHAGVSDAIANLQAQLPGAVISRAGPVQTAQELVTYSWTLGLEGRVPAASGRDVRNHHGGMTMTDNVIAESDQATRNTEIVVTAMRELFVEKDLTALDRYWAEPYVQRSPQMPDGLDTLRTAVPGLQGFSWEPQRTAAQGDVVFTHSLAYGWAPALVVIVDIFRLENGRIVEHRDVVQDLTVPESTASGNPMV